MTRVEELVRKHAGVLEALNKVNRRAKASVMATAHRDLVATLVACARGIIKRQVPLNRQQTRTVRRSANDILELVDTRSLVRKRQILQRGGVLSALLGPLLSLLPSLLGGILGGGRRRR